MTGVFQQRPDDKKSVLYEIGQRARHHSPTVQERRRFWEDTDEGGRVYFVSASQAKGGRLKTHQMTNSVIIDPELESAHAVVLYGGLFGWEGGWFLHEIPTYLQVATVFCLPKHYTYDCTKCLDELHSKVNPDKIISYSLCGYSRGGIEVYRYCNLKDWRLLGLIDPSAPTLGKFKDEVLDGFKDKIRCVYWVPNWGKDGYGGRVPHFAQHLRDLKVKMVEQPTEHEFMPALFFDVYHKEFIL